MSYTDDLDYPIRGDDALAALVIGGALSLAALVLNIVVNFVGALTLGIGYILFPIIFIPLVIQNGYMVRVVRETLDGHADAPRFQEDFEGLGMDGLKFLGVTIAYNIPVAIVSILFGLVVVFFVLGGVAAAGSDSGIAGALLGGGGVILPLLGVGLVGVLTLLITYLLPVGICSMVDSGTFSAAFDFDRLKTVALSSDYAIAWTLGVVLASIIGFVGSLLTVLLVGFLIVFAAQMLAFRLFARGYLNALDRDPSATVGSSDDGPSAAQPTVDGGYE